MAPKEAAVARPIGDGPPHQSRPEPADLPTPHLLTVREAAALLHVPEDAYRQIDRRDADGRVDLGVVQQLDGGVVDGLVALGVARAAAGRGCPDGGGHSLRHGIGKK